MFDDRAALGNQSRECLRDHYWAFPDIVIRPFARLNSGALLSSGALFALRSDHVNSERSMSRFWLMMNAATSCAATLLLPHASFAANGSAEQRYVRTSFVLIEHQRSATFTARQPEPALSPGREQSRVIALPRLGSATRARVLAAVRAAELRHSLPIGLLDALIATESAYVPWAISRAGAGGLAQLMPATAAELGVADRFDPLQSIEGGARYLRRMLDRFGSVSLALAAYNAGPGSVRRAGGIPFNGETPGYVAQVLRRWTSFAAR
jgi:soluble lytic murein transglycosylase-like protein